MAKLVSTTYGDALLELALEEDRLDGFSEEVTAVRQVFLENEELGRVLDHPKVTREEKLDLISNVFDKRISDELLGFLRIIVEKGRQDQLIAVFDHFLHEVKEHKGIGTAHVTSAVALSGPQKTALEARLLQTTRYHSFEMDYQVDPAILGGLVIRIEDRVVDSSLKTRIDNLSRQLARIQLGDR